MKDNSKFLNHLLIKRLNRVPPEKIKSFLENQSIDISKYKLKKHLLDILIAHKDIMNHIVTRKIQLENNVNNSINCNNMFDAENIYKNEEQLIASVFSEIYENTTAQGNSLEELMKTLFGRIKFIDKVEITNRDIAIGQIDLQLTPIDEIAYDILGLISEKPQGMIGECKNYKSGKSASVGREEIEKNCWRCCKSGSLSFFIAPKFTSGALNEIDEFNLYKSDICQKHKGVFVVPLNLEIIKFVIENKINFCYFISWAIHYSKTHRITSYFRG